jgi:hypothetical protein
MGPEHTPSRSNSCACLTERPSCVVGLGRVAGEHEARKKLQVSFDLERKQRGSMNETDDLSWVSETIGLTIAWWC